MSLNKVVKTNTHTHTTTQTDTHTHKQTHTHTHTYEKFTFDQHIEHITDKCTKLIHALSRSAKIAWRLSHKAMRTIYQGAILPLIS